MWNKLNKKIDVCGIRKFTFWELRRELSSKYFVFCAINSAVKFISILLDKFGIFPFLIFSDVSDNMRSNCNSILFYLVQKKSQ